MESYIDYDHIHVDSFYDYKYHTNITFKIFPEKQFHGDIKITGESLIEKIANNGDLKKIIEVLREKCNETIFKVLNTSDKKNKDKFKELLTSYGNFDVNIQSIEKYFNRNKPELKIYEIDYNLKNNNITRGGEPLELKGKIFVSFSKESDDDVVAAANFQKNIVPNENEGYFVSFSRFEKNAPKPKEEISNNQKIREYPTLKEKVIKLEKQNQQNEEQLKQKEEENRELKRENERLRNTEESLRKNIRYEQETNIERRNQILKITSDFEEELKKQIENLSEAKFGSRKEIINKVIENMRKKIIDLEKSK